MTERAVSFTADAWEDYVYWSETDRAMLK
nr:type II toxin-antitoxin system YoeB family toxin [Betaproteobacteria bacterium]